MSRDAARASWSMSESAMAMAELSNAAGCWKVVDTPAFAVAARPE